MNRLRIVNRVLVAVCAGAAALPMAACSSQSESGSNPGRSDVVSYAAINEEYKRSAATLDWPDSYRPPAELNEGSTPDTGYQKGYGDMRASQLYECAWEMEWLRTYATDHAKADAAIEHLAQVPNMRYMQESRADESTRRFFQDYLDRAKLGDPSGFQEGVELNCAE